VAGGARQKGAIKMARVKEKKMFPVCCDKCECKLLEGAPADSMTYCNKCNRWIKAGPAKEVNNAADS
jgi:hypothetical protein